MMYGGGLSEVDEGSFVDLIHVILKREVVV